MDQNIMILGENRIYSLDTHKTKVNNNVLVVGTSGAGKTRGIVIPNLLQASGSYIVSDPKGNLYRQYKPYLESRGYDVKLLDFSNPAESCHYNFFNYIRCMQDIVKISHMLIYQRKEGGNMDPFWDEASQLLLQSIIGYLYELNMGNEGNLHNVLRLINLCQIQEDDSSCETQLDKIMGRVGRVNPDSYSFATYTKFRVAAAKTLKSILITINAKLGTYDIPEITEMTSSDDVDIASIGRKKTALFVVVSDTDRSMDGLANLFFSQAMNELCRYADNECENSCLPVPVRFILDDFATNCRIEEFPRMIASIRSRGISTMLMIQAESQLTTYYGHDGKTIIGNCDTYVYLGGNDVETARAVAERCDLPLRKILNMPLESHWIFRRGQEPVFGKNLDLEKYLKEMPANIVERYERERAS